MTITSPARPAPALLDLVEAVRRVIDARADWARTATLVADQLVEHEELYDDELNLIGARDSYPGEVSGFAPPGDIHRIRNTGSRTAISLHIYGTDITRIGSSARRYYSEPTGGNE